MIRAMRATSPPWSAQKDTGPAASGQPEWWVYADAAPWKLVAICQGPDAEANARLVVAAHDLLTAPAELRVACVEAYKAGRIPAEPFVRAGNVLAQNGGAR